jgi:hypothetical protein
VSLKEKEKREKKPNRWLIRMEQQNEIIIGKTYMVNCRLTTKKTWRKKEKKNTNEI